MIETAVRAETLHMVELRLDPYRLGDVLKEKRSLSPANIDMSYAAHVALKHLFGKQSLRPYFIDAPLNSVQETANRRNGRPVRLVGYGASGAGSLAKELRLSSPIVADLCDQDDLMSHEFPTGFDLGRRLQFEIRACPVIRKASAGSITLNNGEERSWDEGRELDVFVDRAWKNDGTSINRQDVYSDWLSGRIASMGGADVQTDSVSLKRFNIPKMSRRAHGSDPEMRTVQSPDATLTGELTVTDPEAFDELLRSSIGYHGAFGFGMLRVRSV